MPTPRRRLHTTTYLLRNVPNELWHPFSAQVEKRGQDKRTVLLRLIEQYVAKERKPKL